MRLVQIFFFMITGNISFYITPMEAPSKDFVKEHKTYNVNFQDSRGITLLMKHVTDTNLDAVKALLTAGANPNLQDFRGYTALSYALHTRHNVGASMIIDALLKAGVDPRLGDCPDSHALTIIHNKLCRCNWDKDLHTLEEKFYLQIDMLRKCADRKSKE